MKSLLVILLFYIKFPPQLAVVTREDQVRNECVSCQVVLKSESSCKERATETCMVSDGWLCVDYGSMVSMPLVQLRCVPFI